MAFYEHVFIARPDLSEAQVKTMIDDFTKVIKTNKGKVVKDEYWGLKSMAYKIKKNKKAHYVLFNIDGPHKAVAEMENKQRFEENVLRFMTVRVDELEEGPSVVMRAKSEDGYDRPRRHHRDRDDRPERKDPKAEPKKEDKPAAKEAKDTKAEAKKDEKPAAKEAKEAKADVKKEDKPAAKKDEKPEAKDKGDKK